MPVRSLPGGSPTGRASPTLQGGTLAPAITAHHDLAELHGSHVPGPSLGRLADAESPLAVLREAVLVFHELGPEETIRQAVIMEEYQDTPMDLADASLVATAESLGLAEIFTLDHHFQVYRLKGSRPFVIVG